MGRKESLFALAVIIYKTFPNQSQFSRELEISLPHVSRALAYLPLCLI